MMTRSVKHLIGLDTLVFILTAIVSLEMNLPYALDQLAFHKAMHWMGSAATWLCPFGDRNPLILMGDSFVPYKLMIRTMTLAILVIWILIDLRGRGHSVKSFLIAGLIIGHVLIPQAMLIRARLAADNHALAHDGGTIQIEESMKMLLSGKNPYHHTFHDTPLENWRGFRNNVIYHVPYMPGAFLYPLPFYLAVHSIMGSYDQRLLHILLYILCFPLIAGLVRSPAARRTAWLVFGLNPLFIRYFLLGANDIMILSLILLAVYWIEHDHPASGLMVLAAACSVKQFAWFFVPFLSVRALTLDPLAPGTWLSHLRRQWAVWVPGAVLAVLTITPFVLWNPSDFFQDTVLYGSGGLETSYPMQGFHGYGFASVLLFLRIVPRGDMPFPFIILQGLTGVPLAIGLWVQFARRRAMTTALVTASLLLLVFLFFSRYLHANFVGFIMFWPVLAACMEGDLD